MSGLDWHRAPIHLREALSFTRSQVLELDRRLRRQPGVAGCVLLSTCNRTELYLSWTGEEVPAPDRLLCQLAGVGYESFAPAFVTRRGEEAARHLMEVAGGLRSQIWGEDQIVTQVKAAVQAAREVEAADGVLETLFRNAAAAGKEIKSKVRLTGVPRSAAQSGVERLSAHLGGLTGKRALVIGNGEMGRLAASLLRQRGAAVTITLRSYHHGETVVPPGCAVTPYENRYEAMEGMDLLLSATTSPHYTVSADEFSALTAPPAVLVDLAIPRDIQPDLTDRFPGLTLLNVDDLRQSTDADQAVLQRVGGVISTYLDRFHQWGNYRESLVALEDMKAALRRRIGVYVEENMGAEEAAELAIDKVVDLLAGGMTDGFTPEAVRACTAKIRLHTR